MNRPVPRAVIVTGIAGTVFIACFAFWLSFTSLTHLARRAGIAEQQAWAWPAIVDGIIVVATVAVVALRGRPGHVYAWVLLICGALVSVTANAVQAAMPPGVALAPGLAAAVSAVPPIVLLAITHLTVVLARHDDPPEPIPTLDTTHAPNGEPATGNIAPVPAPPWLGAAPALPGESGLSGGGLQRLLWDFDTGPVRPAVPGGGVWGGPRTLQISEASRLKGEGLSNRAIGARLGVNPTTVGRWLKRHDQGANNE